MSIKDIGPVMQIAFVPTDFDAALAYWTQVMGVGPFYLIQNIERGDLRYLGEPTGCKFSLALAYWGDMQIELIRPENDAPGIYRGKYGVSGDVLHHTCILTDNLAQARKTAEAAGAKVLVEGTVGDDGGVIYVDTGGGAGSIVEILQPASGSESLFAMIKAASVGWDGSDPVRKLG